MSLKVWLEELKVLHAKAKEGKLSEHEAHTYEASRNQLARAMLASQQLTLKPGETPRRALRVARALQLDLDLSTGILRTPTVDISLGGFAALLPSDGVPNEAVNYTIRLPGTDVLKGKARPLDSKKGHGHVRVSFAFENLDEEGRTRLEFVVFDTALAMMKV